MWKLVRLSLSYHRKAVLWMLLAALILSKLGLVIAAVVGMVVLWAEGRERRLLLHLPLPVTRAQVGWARVALPAVILILGTLVVTAALFIAHLVAGDAWPFAEAALEELFFGLVLMYFLELLLLLDELQLWGGGRFLGALKGLSILLLMLVGTFSIGIILAMFGSDLLFALGTAALTLALMAVTVSLFQRRPSFAGG